MTRLARLEAELDEDTLPEALRCSVLWLIPDDGAELSETARRLAQGPTTPSCRAVLCRPSSAQPPSILTSITGRDPVLVTSLEFPGAASTSEVADVDLSQDHDFWKLFSSSTYQRQLCAGMFFDEAGHENWISAAIQLATVAGSPPFWRLATAHSVQESLLRAFLVETITAGGIAITKVAPEMFRAGPAFTGTQPAIDRLEQLLGPVEPADEVAVRHSLELAGPWPR